ncbi:hypothetical protein KQX54_016687, partial [Cotesia glomerata]
MDESFDEDGNDDNYDLTGNADQDIEEDATEENSCSQWGRDILEEVKSNLDNNGKEKNAHHNEKLVTKILDDIKRIPLWSCICYDKFSTGGRIGNMSLSQLSNVPIDQ